MSPLKRATHPFKFIKKQLTAALTMGVHYYIYYEPAGHGRTHLCQTVDTNDLPLPFSEALVLVVELNHKRCIRALMRANTEQRPLSQ